MTNKAKIGASIVLDGEKEFKSAVTACSKKLATMRSELGLAKEKYAENANSLTALQDKHKVLSNILNSLRQIVKYSRMKNICMRRKTLLMLKYDTREK